MKRLVLAITLASLAALHTGGAPAPRARECPIVVVLCPDTLRAGEPVTFTASIDNAPADAKLTYNWVVSAGTINSGQGTSSVTVDMTGLYNGAATATVEVSGLPESCPKTASCSTALPLGCYLDKIDEYGNLKFEDEQARLDNFAIELLGGPEFVGYLIGYGGRRSQRGEAARRMERAKKYLTTVRGVPADRIVTIDGGYREELTVELRIRGKDMQPPQPSPTVDPNEVEFIKPPTKRRARHR